MISGEGCKAEATNRVVDILRGMIPVSSNIPNSSNLISSPSVNSRGMEKFGIGISLSELVYYGFHPPEFFLIFENITKIILEERF